MVLNKDVFAKAKLLLWSVTIFAYFFQFPFPVLSFLIVPCLLGYLLLNLFSIKILKNRLYTASLILFGICLVVMSLVSLFKGVELTRIIRFLAILFLIPVAFCITDKEFQTKKEIFIKLAVVKSVIIIFFALLMIYYGKFGLLRVWAFENKLGDIYFLNRFFPKVQVHGNSLLLVAFIIEFTIEKKFTLKNTIILFGVLCAGNFAFILALIAFFGGKAVKYCLEFVQKHPKLKVAVLAVAFVAAAAISAYVFVKIKEKSMVSNAVRLEQAKILLSPSAILGNGLGSWIEYSSNIITYHGDMYFEMQTFYIINQIGVIGIALFYIATLFPMYFAGKKRFVLYLIYLLFSFWNPYCFDSTQIITIVLLMNTTQLGDYNEKSDYYSLFPFSKCFKKYSWYSEAG